MNSHRTLNNVLRIKRLYSYLNKNRTQWLSTFDITATQCDVLMFLYDNMDNTKINQKSLEEYLMVSNPAVSGVIKRLQDKGLISSKQSTIDARNKCLTLTKTGLHCAQTIIEKGRDSQDLLLIKGMTNEEADQFQKLLNHALKNLEVKKGK